MRGNAGIVPQLRPFPYVTNGTFNVANQLVSAGKFLLSHFSGFLKFIALLPASERCLVRDFPAQNQSEFRHLGVGRKVHVWPILIRWLVIAVGHIIALFFLTPGKIM